MVEKIRAAAREEHRVDVIHVLDAQQLLGRRSKLGEVFGLLAPRGQRVEASANDLDGKIANHRRQDEGPAVGAPKGAAVEDRSCEVFEQVDDFVIGCVLATKQVFEYHVFIFIDLACSKNQFRFVI